METQTESLRQAEISAPTTSSSADQSGPEAALESTLVDNLEEKVATQDNSKEEVQEREIRPQVSEPALKRYVHEFLRLHNVTFYKTDYRQLREYVEKKLCLPDGFLKPSDQHPMDFQQLILDTVEAFKNKKKNPVFRYDVPPKEAEKFEKNATLDKRKSGKFTKTESECILKIIDNFCELQHIDRRDICPSNRTDFDTNGVGGQGTTARRHFELWSEIHLHLPHRNRKAIYQHAMSLLAEPDKRVS